MKLIWKVESCRLHVHQSLVGEDVLQQLELPGSSLAGLCAPTSGAAHEVLCRVVREGGLDAREAVGVPPQ